MPSAAVTASSSANGNVHPTRPYGKKRPSVDSSSVKVPMPPPAASAVSPAAAPAVSFDRLLRLLEEPASAPQHERHAVELQQIAQLAVKGFTVRHALDSLPKVLAHISRAIRKDPSGARVGPLFDPLTDVIRACALPLQSRTLDDQRNYQLALGGLLDSVASLLTIPHAALRAVCAVTLSHVFAFIREQCGDDITTQRTEPGQKRKEYYQAIRRSTVQQIVAAWSAALHTSEETQQKVQVLESAAKRGDDSEEPDEGVLAPLRTPETEANATEMMNLMTACVELSHYASLCEALTDAGTCQLTCRTMKLCRAGDRRLTLCVELLWNLLQLHGPAAEACSNAACIQSLYDVLLLVLQNGHKQKERELRNDFIVLVTLIADCDDSMPLLVPFAELLLDLSCGAEQDIHNVHIHPKFHYTTHHCELQMKTLAWKFLEKLCQKSETYCQAIFDWGYLDVLLRYINIRCEQPAVVRWSTEQLLDLQRSVLNQLVLMASLATEPILNGGAIPTIVEYIHECPDKPLRNLAVGALASIARTQLRPHLGECGVIQLALELLQEQDQFDNVLRVDCLSMLADVVDRDPALQTEFLEWDGIRAILPLLCFQPDYYTDLRESIVFGALDCIWSCVTGNRDCEAAFVRADGIHYILSVLETCPADMKRFPLTCLADLLRHPAAVAEFRGWISDRTQRSAAQLLLSLWTGKGTAVVSPDSVHIEMNASGDLNDTAAAAAAAAAATAETPIGLRSIGASTKRTTLSAKPDASTSTQRHALHDRDDPHALAAADGAAFATQRKGLIQIAEDIAEIVEENVINFKVHCCFSQVGIDDHKELTLMERSVLASVQLFVELCKDEVWTAVADSIANDGLQPVAADQEKLRRVREVAVARCQELASTRDALRKAHEDGLTAKEETFYRTIIKKTDEKQPTTKGSALSITEAKIRKALMLKASFKAAMAKQQAHRTGAATPNIASNAGGSTPTLTNSAAERKAMVPSVAKGGSERWGLGQRAMSDVEFALLQMINKVRTDPKSLIPHIKQKLTYLNEEGNAFMEPGKPIENCVEGAAPYLELIELLEAARPIVTLLDVPMGLLLAARDHVNDLGKRMEATQEGADGSTPQMRMNRYGRVGSKSVQLMGLNHQDALDLVIQLAVDDGIASRIDRKAIFDPDMRVAGVAMGKHSIHEHVAVILLAHEYVDKPPNEQRDIFLKFNSPPARKIA